MATYRDRIKAEEKAAALACALPVPKAQPIQLRPPTVPAVDAGNEFVEAATLAIVPYDSAFARDQQSQRGLIDETAADLVPLPPVRVGSGKSIVGWMAAESKLPNSDDSRVQDWLLCNVGSSVASPGSSSEPDRPLSVQRLMEHSVGPNGKLIPGRSQTKSVEDFTTRAKTRAGGTDDPFPEDVAYPEFCQPDMCKRGLSDQTKNWNKNMVAAFEELVWRLDTYEADVVSKDAVYAFELSGRDVV